MVTDVELSRALNAIVVTLNDQKATRFDRGRVQRIVTGALAGREDLVAVEIAESGGVAGRLEEDGSEVARVTLSGGSWAVERCRSPAGTHAYIPAKS